MIMEFFKSPERTKESNGGQSPVIRMNQVKLSPARTKEKPQNNRIEILSS